MNPLATIHLGHGSPRALLGSRSPAEWTPWLSLGEREVLARLADPGRRDAWTAGRVLGKRLLLRHVLSGRDWDGVGPEEIEIHSRDVLGRPARPRVTVRGRVEPWPLSIAHTDHAVIVAVSGCPRVSVGVDVTAVGPSTRGFRELWLTPAERRWCESTQDPGVVSTLWAVKEALYKATNRGERFAPAAIEVFPGPAGGYAWRPGGRGLRSAATVRVDALGDEIAAIAAVAATEGSA